MRYAVHYIDGEALGIVVDLPLSVSRFGDVEIVAAPYGMDIVDIGPLCAALSRIAGHPVMVVTNEAARERWLKLVSDGG